jgi:hypothetical protein
VGLVISVSLIGGTIREIQQPLLREQQESFITTKFNTNANFVNTFLGLCQDSLEMSPTLTH